MISKIYSCSNLYDFISGTLISLISRELKYHKQI